MNRSAWMFLCCLGAIALGCQDSTARSPEARDRAHRIEAVSEILARAVPDAWTRTDQGFASVIGAPQRATAPGSFVSLGRSLEVAIPLLADGPWSLGATSGHEVVVHRRGASAEPCADEDGVVLCRSVQPGVDALVLVDGPRLEELLVLEQPVEQLGYDVTLPMGWSVASVAADSRTVQLLDERGAAQLRIAAPGAWDAEGSPVAVELQVDGDGVAIHVGSAALWPVVVDPSFVDASVPLRLRGTHTATLLLDGRILIAGGLTDELIDDTAEIYDPTGGTSTAIDPLMVVT